MIIFTVFLKNFSYLVDRRSKYYLRRSGLFCCMQNTSYMYRAVNSVHWVWTFSKHNWNLCIRFTFILLPIIMMSQSFKTNGVYIKNLSVILCNKNKHIYPVFYECKTHVKNHYFITNICHCAVSPLPYPHPIPFHGYGCQAPQKKETWKKLLLSNFVRIHFIIGCKQYILYLYILYSDFGLRMIRVWTELFCSTW